MRFSRVAAAIASVRERAEGSRLGPWAWCGAVCIAGLVVGAYATGRDLGWRSVATHAGLFGALAVVIPDARRRTSSSFADLTAVSLACLLELAIRPGVSGLLIGVAGSAAGWSLGRSALAASRLVATASGSSAAQIEACAVNWFMSLQKTPPERFDWNGLERWMREHPSHRDAYQRVEAIWYALPAEDAPVERRKARAWVSRARAMTRFGLWMAPAYAARFVVLAAALGLSAAGVYA